MMSLEVKARPVEKSTEKQHLSGLDVIIYWGMAVRGHYYSGA